VLRAREHATPRSMHSAGTPVQSIQPSCPPSSLPRLVSPYTCEWWRVACSNDEHMLLGCTHPTAERPCPPAKA
jgi:hypothetical protein